MTTLSSKPFVFIAGVEGSGTTMMMQLLGSLEHVCCLHGSHFSPGMEQQAKDIKALTAELWQYPSIHDLKTRNSLISRINAIRIPESVSHVVYKRSYPFTDQNHYPNLSDVREIGNGSVIVGMTRSFVDNVCSIIRRQFESDLTSATHRIAMAYEILTRQLLDSDQIASVVNYSELADENHRDGVISNLEELLGLNPGSLLEYRDLLKAPTAAGYRKL